MKSKRPPRAQAQHRRRAAVEPGSTADRRWSLAVPAVLAIAVGACYLPCLSGPFMMDDVYSRPSERLGVWTDFEAPPQSPMAGRPIPTWSMTMLHRRYGDAPRPYHLFNIALHAANAMLLWGLVRRTLRLPSVGPTLRRVGEPVAAAIALLWAVHPLCTEAVAYITQRTELFVALFLLATLYLNARTVGTTFPEAWLVASAIACLLGMLCKEVMAVAPLLAMLYDRAYLFPSWRASFSRRWWYYLTLAGTWLVLYRLMASGPRSDSVGFGHGVTAIDYLKRQAIAIAEYVRLAFWPTRQNLDHGDLAHPQLPDNLRLWAYALGGIILATVAVTALVWWRRPAWGFLGAWFFVVLAPTSSFVPIVTEWCAERRMYIPLMAIVAGVVAGIVCLFRRRVIHEPEGEAEGRRDLKSVTAQSIAAWLPVSAAAMVLAIATARRAALYADPIALWSQTVELNPNLFRPRSTLAHMHYEKSVQLRESDPQASRREAEAALEEYGRAVELAPDESKLRYNYGKVSLMLGHAAQAERSFRKAIELHPEYPNALQDLANLLFQSGRYEEAARHYQTLMRIQPQNALWPFNYGLAMRRLGRLDEAHEYFRKAAEFQPAIAEIWAEYAESSWRKLDLDTAEQAAAIALSIDPRNEQALRVGREIQTVRPRPATSKQ